MRKSQEARFKSNSFYMKQSVLFEAPGIKLWIWRPYFKCFNYLSSINFPVSLSIKFSKSRVSCTCNVTLALLKCTRDVNRAMQNYRKRKIEWEGHRLLYQVNCAPFLSPSDSNFRFYDGKIDKTGRNVGSKVLRVCLWIVCVCVLSRYVVQEKAKSLPKPIETES